MRSTRNQDVCDYEIPNQTSLPELMAPKISTLNFESFMDNFKSVVSHVDGIHRVPIDYLLR